VICVEPVTGDLVPVTADLVPVTGDLVPVTGDLVPVTADLVPVTGDLVPVTSDLEPVTGDLEPVTADLVPVTGDLVPVTSDLVPVTSDLEPVTGDLVPVTGDLLESVTGDLEPVKYHPNFIFISIQLPQGNNGPGVITRVAQQLCGSKNVTEMIAKKRCKNFSVLPIETCYSIRWPEHIKFFKEEFLNETLSRLDNSLIAHVWNKHSAATALTREANVAYVHIAKEHCPKVIKASEFF
jgi:hypothetical protein